MIKRYCDCCGAEITDGFRNICVGDGTNHIAVDCGKEVDPETTMISKEICIECAKKIIAPFRANKIAEEG